MVYVVYIRNKPRNLYYSCVSAFVAICIPNNDVYIIPVQPVRPLL